MVAPFPVLLPVLVIAADWSFTVVLPVIDVARYKWDNFLVGTLPKYPPSRWDPPPGTMAPPAYIPPRVIDCPMKEEWQVFEGKKGKFKKITPLEIAVLTDDISAVEMSLSKGCDVNYDGTTSYPWYDSGSTPLMLAAKKASLEVAQLLVSQPGIQVDKIIKDKQTALAFAVKRPGNLDMVKLLVEHGAKAERRDKYGYSPLHEAAAVGALEIVKYLHSIGANIHNQDNGLTTPLWKAVFGGKLPMVRYLVGEGASIDSPQAYYGFYPINAAVSKGDVEMVEFLIEQGVDVNIKGGRVGNPIRSNIEIARYEMNRGFSYEIYEKKPRYEEVIRMLKAVGSEE